MIGQTLSHYKIIEKLGAGGQGEVYLAEDSRLDRKVALKILPQHLSERAELRERFEREARAVSSLNHPHICTLYDIGEQDGIHFLVMEHLEGETLAARLEKGALPLEQTLEYAIQIADALDKAHRQGVVHRDLKPGNIMLVKSGAKLLDFGLAKLHAAETPTNLSALPTEQASLTAEGTILGTLQYMAPEQLEAKEADSRTDIFAFGAVVYEMATGKKAFEGQSQASLIAAIMGQDPRPMAELQPMTPELLDQVVKKCLEKEPDERWQSASDLMTGLKWVTEVGTPVDSLPSGTPPAAWRRAIPWGIAAVATGAVILVSLFFRADTEVPQIVHSSVLPPEETVFDSNAGPMALSPDGQLLAFVVQTPEEKRMLWVRPLDSGSAQLLPGTEDAFAPFWSHNSRSLGFFADGKLKKIDASGGTVETLYSPVERGMGGTWNQDGIILFHGGRGKGIQRIPSTGGASTPVTALNENLGEFAHRWPFFLPDGNHFLYLAETRSSDQTDKVYLSSLDGNSPTLLLNSNSNAIYAAPGYLLFWREGTLRAQRFDPERLQLMGEALPVVPNVRFDALSQGGLFSASQNGVLTYQAGSQAGLSQLIWFDRTGNQLEPVGEPGNYYFPRLSHNGLRVAVDVSDLQNNGDIWLYELSRPVPLRFTFDPVNDSAPVWSPDDSRIVFSSTREGARVDLYQKTVGSTANEEVLLANEFDTAPTDWSPDGDFIALRVWRPDQNDFDIWVFSIQDQKATPFLATPFNEEEGQFSPDGKWMVYISDESGQDEIYVQPFPGPGAKWRISTKGGGMPRWGPDGRELFYLATDQRLMRVDIKMAPEVEIGEPQSLFLTRLKWLGMGPTQYDVSADGQRFLINTLVEEQDTTPITLVLNWFEELKRLVPTDN